MQRTSSQNRPPAGSEMSAHGQLYESYSQVCALNLVASIYGVKKGSKSSGGTPFQAVNASPPAAAREGSPLRSRKRKPDTPIIYCFLTQISVLDFLGQGTACIVWSSPLPSHSGRGSMRYIDLMGGRKPNLMTGYDSGMGKTVSLEYTPSTKFYLEDREAGNPWVAKLPFPVHCLSKVTARDSVSGHTFTNSYRYHHGCYDIPEREFRGFGMVEQTDAESFDGGSEPLNQHPVLTKTWHHLGAWIKNKEILGHYETEYNPAYKSEGRLGQPDLDKAWSTHERREAMRSLRGMPLRQEVYALDGSELESVPYAATQFSYRIERLQPKDENRHAVFQSVQSETLTHHCERNAADPRAAHSLVLGTDRYGRPTLSAEIVYGRKAGTAHEEQVRKHIVIKETQYADDASGNGMFRMGLECAAKTWELTGAAQNGIFKAAEIAQTFSDATEILFEAEHAQGLQKRLVESTETLFYDNSLTGALPLGSMASHGLPYESYSLAYTQGLLTHIYGAKPVSPAMLAEGGFVLRGGNWQMRTGRNVYAPDAANNFCLPNGVENAFGQTTSIAYDQHSMLIESVTDPLGNTVSAVNDYRTLSPKMLTDPNGNRTAAETDALGIVVRTAIMGKAGANEGDTLADPTARMEYGFAEFDSSGKLVKPSWVKTFSRETHGDQNTRWLEQIEYSDGMGNVALAKAKAEPDKDGNSRWIGTGRTVLNNKGNPVKQYEPYFSGTEEWENEDEARNIGVTPIMHYDPLSRLIRTDFPDGTHSKVEFTAWEQKDYDRCDTAEGSPHYDTPTVTHLDSLGRAFLVIADDGERKLPTKTVLDIEGNEKRIIDARGNAVMEYRHGIHGEKGYTKSMDAGERWMLIAADGQPVCTWDSRGHKLRIEYDALRRPTKQWLNDSTLVGETIYGTDAANNLIGQPWKVHDQSGVTESMRFDFKGNLLESKKKFTTEYKNTIDWNANPILENEEFTTVTAYDALNRATNIFTPNNGNVRSEIIPGYDEGGLLKTVKAKLRGSANETEFITSINYNPKGQRKRIKYGNGATTKYEYDKNNFRLTKLLTTRNNGTETLQDLEYEYDEMGNIAKITNDSQQTIFFNGQVVNPVCTENAIRSKSNPD